MCGLGFKCNFTRMEVAYSLFNLRRLGIQECHFNFQFLTVIVTVKCSLMLLSLITSGDIIFLCVDKII